MGKQRCIARSLNNQIEVNREVIKLLLAWACIHTLLFIILPVILKSPGLKLDITVLQIILFVFNIFLIVLSFVYNSKNLKLKKRLSFWHSIENGNILLNATETEDAQKINRATEIIRKDRELHALEINISKLSSDLIRTKTYKTKLEQEIEASIEDLTIKITK